MLNRLYIKNIALIESADIEFAGGLNVLSGETGAGKSVILDCLNFVLGSKADKSMIRFGESEATVKAEFTVEPNSMACKALADMDIESDGTAVIVRKLNADGKNSVKINGNSVTASMLKSFTSHLVDVHGQSEHFFLLSESNQLKVIDKLCDGKLEDYKSTLSRLIARNKEIAQTISELGGSDSLREQKLDFLEYQINEIKAAELRVGEYNELLTKRKLIDNVSKILEALNAVKNVLSDDGGCSDMLTVALRQLAGISDFEKSYENLYNRLDNLSVEAQDISETASDLIDNLSFDEDEARIVEERLTLIKSLIKKYGGSEEAVLSHLEECERSRDALLDSAALTDKLNKETQKNCDEIYSVCLKITEIRKAACREFCNGVVAELKTLNIPHATFTVEFEAYDENNVNLNSANGSDNISFMFSANKGEPVKPLSKVISGGEMSRFMLALKTRLKEINGISTYIFDEIDAGISGFTALTVAEKFIDISKSAQIIAVSHLPQICAAADEQYLIYKTENLNKTNTYVKKLSGEERTDEIIRLTGGDVNSDTARLHAKELIAKFK